MIHPEDRVLVCLVNHPRDLEIARWDHWYRVPARSAPREYLADVLCFYLTADFGDEKWAIHEYARVRGHELVRRVDLFPDEPAHPRAAETYFKYQLGPLERLARPIPSLKWRRILFMETSGDQVLRALEIADLAEDRGRIRLMDEDEGPLTEDEQENLMNPDNTIDQTIVEDLDGITVIRGGGGQRAWNGIKYMQGLSGKNAGAKDLSINVATVPPGAIAYAHIHDGFEVMLFIVQGRVRHAYGENLAQEVFNEAGDFIYIKPGVPHEVYNVGDGPLIAFVARSTADEWDKIVNYPSQHRPT